MQSKRKGAVMAPRQPDPVTLVATMRTRRGVVLMLPGRPEIEVAHREFEAVVQALQDARTRRPLRRARAVVPMLEARS